MTQAVANHLRDGQHLQPMGGAEALQVGHARHGAVVVHDLADDAGRDEAGHARQVDGGFGLAGAHQHAAFARAQRKDVAGTRQVGCGCVAESMATRIVWARSAAEMPVVTPSRASMLSVKAVPKREVFSCDIRRQAQVVGALLGEGQADEAAAVAGHEVDGFGSDIFGGQREVAFVFAVFVVHDDDHAAGLDLGDGAGHIDEGKRGASWSGPFCAA